MHIKEVILDGFKSYANRTVVPQFDASFNAITGLNGTGKSNILDSICFVLGISNLSQVRVNNLQELVYKQGQSRVTKATVTIVFDNSDTKTSPIGYEQFKEITITRQVILGGRNKYLINGHTAQLQRVQNLFHSVGLNVNNPHFLIMQGRITKVVNMKPVEVLGMLEEAAGTRVYENKKKMAMRIMEKKQLKVQELTTILEQEIIPTITRLRNEQATFAIYSKNQMEIDKLTKLITAYSYVERQKQVEVEQQKLQREQELQLKHQNAYDMLNIELDALQQQLSELNAKLQISNDNPVMNKLKKQYEQQAKAVTQVQTQVEQLQKSLKEEKHSLKEHNAALKENQQTLATLQSQLQQSTGTVATKQAEAKRLQDLISSIRSQQLGIDSNADSSSSSGGGMTGELLKEKQRLSTLEGELKGIPNKRKHLEQQLAQKKKQLQSAEREGSQSDSELANKQVELQHLQQQLQQHQQNAPQQQTQRHKVHSELNTLNNKLNDLTQTLQQRRIQLQNFSFDYQHSNQINDNKIKGLIASLIQIVDEKYTVALEVTAGGRLYNVVVDDEQTGKALLQHGQLKKRVTVIPLDTVKSRPIEDQKYKRAQQLAEGNGINIASQLVTYHSNVSAAIQYVFGNTFIAENSATAQRVTFNPDIRVKSVTLSGDVHDPAGTLSGGSQSQNGSMLMQFKALQQLDAEHSDLLRKQQSLQKQLTAIDDANNQQVDIQQRVDLLQHEIKHLGQRQSQSAHSILQQEQTDLQQQLASLNQSHTDIQQSIAQCKATIGQLEETINASGGSKEAQAKALDDQLAKTNKQLAAMQTELKALTATHERLNLELTDAQSDIDNTTAAIDKSQATIEQLQQDIETSSQAAYEAEAQSSSIQQQLDAEKAKIAENNKEIDLLLQRKAQKTKQQTEVEDDVKRNQQNVKRYTTAVEEVTALLKALLQQHEWLQSESKQFGKPGGDYDFKALQMEDKKKRYVELQAEQKELSKAINAKAMNMFERAEAEYTELCNKRTIIESDKSKIERVITELDRKKHEALEVTWKKVTKDFNSIFGSLLPGTSAALEKPEGATSILDGLEVRVAFGGVWKESLSELSGGQRSLLALSLILSLLLFKPAPMYILDEVDAALDLSHTQNIGVMLKQHFPMSQFIVVSLKEGMFNNANVIFRTKFVDGVSAVTRTVNTPTVHKGKVLKGVH